MHCRSVPREREPGHKRRVPEHTRPGPVHTLREPVPVHMLREQVPVHRPPGLGHSHGVRRSSQVHDCSIPWVCSSTVDTSRNCYTLAGR